MWYTQVDHKVVELSFIVGEKYNTRICILLQMWRDTNGG